MVSRVPMGFGWVSMHLTNLSLSLFCTGLTQHKCFSVRVCTHSHARLYTNVYTCTHTYAKAQILAYVIIFLYFHYLLFYVLAPLWILCDSMVASLLIFVHDTTFVVVYKAY